MSHLCGKCLAEWPLTVIEPEEDEEQLYYSYLGDHPCATTTTTGQADWLAMSCCEHVVEVNPDGGCGISSTSNFEYPCAICNYGDRDMSNFDNTRFLPPPVETDYVDCGTCTDYYPEDSLGSSKDEYGKLSPLTRHACAYYDSDSSNCCRYDSESGLCGVYMDYMFLYPCGPSCNNDNEIIMKTTLISVGTILAVAVLGFLMFFWRKRTRTRNSQKDANPGSVKVPALGIASIPIPVDLHATPVVFAEKVDNHLEVPIVYAHPEPY